VADVSLEAELERLERDADVVVQQLASALKEAKRVKSAAANGQLRELRSTLDTSVRLAEEARSAARQLRDGWTFDEQSHFASGAYTKELLGVAAEYGVQAFESEERILSYPVIVSVSPADMTVAIDKKKERRTRPSVLARTLQALQSRPPRFKAQAFLDALAAAYDLVVGKAGRPGATVKLVDVYRVLTVMPGSRREYSKQEFARDLYLLDQSGMTETRDGRRLHLPASALTRGSGVLVTVTRSGQQKVYAGISFEGGGQ
jgi:hypothetical protein